MPFECAMVQVEKCEEHNRGLRRELQQKTAELALLQRDVEHARAQMLKVREQSQAQSQSNFVDTSLNHEAQSSLVNSTRLGSECIYVSDVCPASGVLQTKRGV